jgi:hypothetical protein
VQDVKHNSKTYCNLSQYGDGELIREDRCRVEMAVEQRTNSVIIFTRRKACYFKNKLWNDTPTSASNKSKAWNAVKSVVESIKPRLKVLL